jgi:TonB family protein
MTDESEQIPDSNSVSVPARDRRTHPRQRVRSLSYVELGPGNGGIVLNISEGGIAVQAAEALDETEGLIAMRIEIPGSRKRLEVNGEFAWIGASRKDAGFRFVDLQEDALGRIRAWIAREEWPGSVAEDSDAPDEVPDEVEDHAPEVRAENAGAITSREVFARHEDPVAESQETAGHDEEQYSEFEEPLEDDDQAGFDEEPTDEPAELRADVPTEALAEEPADVHVPEDAAEELAEKPAIRTGPSSPRVEAPIAAAPVNHKAEDRGQKISPPALTFEKKPQFPGSPLTAISGTHGAPAFAIAASSPTTLRYSSGDAATALFPRTQTPPEAKPADDGWKSFRVQLQSGWFLALLVLLLASISFVAGMAVRRGALNGMMGEIDDVAQPKGAPSPSLVPVPSNNNSAATTPAKPLQIEIVDSANHHWTIPAATGSNYADASVARQPDTHEASPPEENARASSATNSPNRNAAPAASSPTTDAARPSAPLMLSLPETPISASGSIAIRATGMVPIPAGDAQSAQHARNLQIGRLTKMVEPVYPPDARQARVEGTVKLHVMIGAEGAIQSLEPVSGPESLTQAAMTAVREWRYSPTLLNGKPVEMQEDVSFVFRLPN